MCPTPHGMSSSITRHTHRVHITSSRFEPIIRIRAGRLPSQSSNVRNFPKKRGRSAAQNPRAFHRQAVKEMGTGPLVPRRPALSGSYSSQRKEGPPVKPGSPSSHPCSNVLQRLSPPEPSDQTNSKATQQHRPWSRGRWRTAEESGLGSITPGVVRSTHHRIQITFGKPGCPANADASIETLRSPVPPPTPCRL